MRSVTKMGIGWSTIIVAAAVVGAGCGADDANERSARPERPEPATADVADVAGDAAWFTGFSPTRGVTGTPIELALSAPAADCVRSGGCSVTIGGAEAAPHDVDGAAALVTIPRFAEGAEVCVTWGDETACLPGLEVLNTLVIDAVVVQQGHGSRQIVVTGEGFPIDATASLDFAPITVEGVTAAGLTARVADDVPAGPYALRVGAPSHSRCGATSEPVVLQLE